MRKRRNLLVLLLNTFFLIEKEVAWTHSEINSMLSCPRNATQGAYPDETKNGGYSLK